MSSKLRTSCNACHMAKVKCAKENSDICVRCQSMNKICQYSQVLPRNAQRQNQASTSNGQALELTLDPSLLENSQFMAEYSVESNDHAWMNPPSDTKWGWKNQENIINATPNRRLSTATYGGLAQSPFASGHASPTSIIGTNDAFGLPSRALGSRNPSLTQLSSTLSRGSSFPDAFSESSTSLNSPASTTLSGSRFVADNLRRHECACMTSILQAIQEVQNNLRAHSLALDTTLKLNRDAITRCQNITKCSVEKDIGFKTIACGLIGLILSSYQAALEHFFNDDHEIVHSRGENSGSKPTKTELTLGGFSIERQDQKTFVKEIVTKEVRKIRELLSSAFIPVAGIEEQHLTETMITYLARKSQAVIAIG